MKNIYDYVDNPPVSLYERLIRRQKGNSAFTILIFFLLAFSLSRFFVYIYQFGILPKYPLENFFGTHIHHFVFGIGLIAIVGFLNLTLPSHIAQSWRLKLSAVYGFGLGWIIDEFGMWLHLEDNYYIRGSYDAVIFSTIVLINFVYFQKIWKSIFYKIFKSLKQSIA